MARQLKQNGVEIHVIAIGNRVDMNEVTQIASDGDEPYVFRISDRDQARDAAARLCDALCQ